MSGAYVLAPDDVRADYGLIETENSDSQDIVDGSDWRDAAWLGEDDDSPGWVIRRLWAWVRGRTVPRGQEIPGDEAEGVDTRASWAQQANRALARAGRPERIHAGSLAQQLSEAERRGDAREVARLAHREPGVHLGPDNVARAERGEPLERTAEAVSVADRKQELAADRADVSRLEQALQHVRG